MLPVWAVCVASVHSIGTAVPGTSERRTWRMSELDEIAVPLSEVMTSPATSPAASAAFPGKTCEIAAPVEVSVRTTPRKAVGPTWTVALDLPYSHPHRATEPDRLELRRAGHL